MHVEQIYLEIYRNSETVHTISTMNSKIKNVFITTKLVSNKLTIISKGTEYKLYVYNQNIKFSLIRVNTSENLSANLVITQQNMSACNKYQLWGKDNISFYTMIAINPKSTNKTIMINLNQIRQFVYPGDSEDPLLLQQWSNFTKIADTLSTVDSRQQYDEWHQKNAIYTVNGDKYVKSYYKLNNLLIKRLSFKQKYWIRVKRKKCQNRGKKKKKRIRQLVNDRKIQNGVLNRNNEECSSINHNKIKRSSTQKNKTSQNKSSNTNTTSNKQTTINTLNNQSPKSFCTTNKSTTYINTHKSHNENSSKKTPEMDDIIPNEIKTTSKINKTRKVSEHNNKNNGRVNEDDGNNSNNHSLQRESNVNYDQQQTNTSDDARY